MRNLKVITSCFLALITLYSCQQDVYVIDKEEDEITTPEKPKLQDFIY